MYSMSLVTLNNEDNLLRRWVSIYVLHDVSCPHQNKFVYCSMFLFCFHEQFRDAGLEQNNGLSKRKKKKSPLILFVFSNVYASVYIEKIIVFMRVGVKDVCDASVFLIEFQPGSMFCPVCSCTKDCISPPVSCDFQYCVQNEQNWLVFCFFNIIFLNTWHPKLFSCGDFSHMYSSCCYCFFKMSQHLPPTTTGGVYSFKSQQFVD